MAKERIFDELICFLGDALFQVPVRTFLDEHCAIFDPSISPSECLEDHKKIHETYKKLVDALLDGFCADSGLTVDKAIKGIKSMNQVPDLQEYFQAIFEQVLAAVDFEIFFRLMCKRNIVIQEQALMVLITMLGSAPESLMKEADQQKQAVGSAAKPGSQMKSQDKEDEEILKQAMEQSKREEESKRAKQRAEERDLQKTLLLSQQEAKLLSSDKQVLDEDMKRLAMEEKPIPKQPSQPTKAAPPPAAAAAPAVKPALISGIQSNVSSSQAANDWLKSAQSETTTSPAQAAVMAQMSKLSPEELKKRQEYLKEQRDKLLAMKKQQREKQLLTAEKANPKRPQSARAARAAMDNTAQPTSQSEEDQRKMAMRRAIADKLKMEVIGK